MWPLGLSSWSRLLCNSTCPSPSSLLSYKNAAFINTWHWYGPKEVGLGGGWRTLTVISYHPLSSSSRCPPPSPLLRVRLVKWVMIEERGCRVHSTQNEAAAKHYFCCQFNCWLFPWLVVWPEKCQKNGEMVFVKGGDVLKLPVLPRKLVNI